MATDERAKPFVDSDSDEGTVSDNDLDEVMDVTAMNPSVNSLNTDQSGPQMVQKRKRGNVWKDAVLEEDLTSSLSKITTHEGHPKPVYMDLDAPSGAGTDAVALSLKARKGSKGRRHGPRESRSGQRAHQGGDSAKEGEEEKGAGDPGSGPVQGSSQAAGVKRKNVQVPRGKRRPAKTHFFSSYPDMNAEIEDTDTLDLAARRAVHQLKEKFNPWAITQVIYHLGNAEARKLLQLTKTIEANGGMLTKDGKNRRTAGGIFITMFKSEYEQKFGKESLKTILTEPPGGLPKKKNIRAKQRQLQKRAERRAQEAAKKNENPEPTEASVPVENKDETMDTNVTDAGNDETVDDGGSSV